MLGREGGLEEEADKGEGVFVGWGWGCWKVQQEGRVTDDWSRGPACRTVGDINGGSRSEQIVTFLQPTGGPSCNDKQVSEA